MAKLDESGILIVVVDGSEPFEFEKVFSVEAKDGGQ